VAAGERVISKQVAGKLQERVRGERAEAKATTPSPAAPAAPRVPTVSRSPRAPAERLTGVPAQDALGEMFKPKHLVQTLVIALVVGGLLTMIWEGEQIQDGETDSETWIKSAVTVFVTFAVINIGVLVGRASD
jgi:hypothetical protein